MGSTAERPGRTVADEAIALALYPQLRRFAAVVASREVEPDDLVHDALVAALRQGSLGSLGSLDEPLAYLRRTMLNLASNHRRRLGRARRAAHRMSGNGEDAAADHYPSDLAHLAQLDPTSRAILYLHDLEGVLLETVAHLLGLKASAVRQRSSRAHRKLRHHLEEVT